MTKRGPTSPNYLMLIIYQTNIRYNKHRIIEIYRWKLYLRRSRVEFFVFVGYSILLLNFSSYIINGKYCCFITFVFSSLWSGTRDGRTTSSLRSSAASHHSSHTVNGKCCCNIHVGGKSWRKIFYCFNTVNGKYCCNDPKAFSVQDAGSKYSFNTVTGKCCCNWVCSWLCSSKRY